MSVEECEVHEWVAVDSPRSAIEAWGCRECEATSASCGVCKRATGSALLVCQPCIRREQRILDDIPRILDQWGNDAVRKGTPGLTARVSGANGSDVGMRAPRDVWAALGAWEDEWAKRFGEVEMGDSTIDYLKGHIIWAAHNPVESRWEEYRSGVRAIRATALAIVGLAPVRLGDRCTHCGGKVVRDRADSKGIAYTDGLQDHVRCTGCATTWGKAEDFKAAVVGNIRQLGLNYPGLYATREQVRKIYPGVAAGTIRQWLKRDRDRYAEDVRIFDEWYDEWTAWQDAGNIGPLPNEPEIRDREIRENETGGIRLGDLHVMVARLDGRADDTGGAKVEDRLQLVL